VKRRTGTGGTTGGRVGTNVPADIRMLLDRANWIDGPTQTCFPLNEKARKMTTQILYALRGHE
jgi:hypothetical protein